MSELKEICSQKILTGYTSSLIITDEWSHQNFVWKIQTIHLLHQKDNNIHIFLYTSSDFKIIHKSMSIQINFKILLLQDFRKVP